MRYAYRDWVANLRKRNNLKDLDLDGRIILKLIFKEWDGGIDWIDLALDRDRCHALVNVVMNLRVT
jgi:hypothetical protein